MGGVEETQLSSAKRHNETKARQHLRFKDKNIYYIYQDKSNKTNGANYLRTSEMHEDRRQQGVHEQT